MLIEAINARFKEALSQSGVLILAHRGVSGGNIMDNTIEAFDAAVRQGADMVEIDVCASLEGDLFVFHDGMEKFHLDFSTTIPRMHTREVQALRYINRNHVKIDHPLNTLDEVLEHLKGRTLINVDRCWDHWDKVMPCVVRHGMADQVLFKSMPDERYLSYLAAQDTPYMYMPIVWHPEEVAFAQRAGVNLAAIEVIGRRESDPIMQPAFLREMREKGIACMIATLTLGSPAYDSGALLARWQAENSRMSDALIDRCIRVGCGRDDDRSILGNPDDGWGWLVERGFNMLMTDWTREMALYLKEKGYRS